MQNNPPNLIDPSKWSYDEIVAHLEKEVELNALEESHGLPKSSVTIRPKNLLSNVLLADIGGNYCKENGHMVKDGKKTQKRKRHTNM